MGDTSKKFNKRIARSPWTCSLPLPPRLGCLAGHREALSLSDGSCIHSTNARNTDLQGCPRQPMRRCGPGLHRLSPTPAGWGGGGASEGPYGQSCRWEEPAVGPRAGAGSSRAGRGPARGGPAGPDRGRGGRATAHGGGRGIGRGCGSREGVWASFSGAGEPWGSLGFCTEWVRGTGRGRVGGGAATDSPQPSASPRNSGRCLLWGQMERAWAPCPHPSAPVSGPRREGLWGDLRTGLWPQAADGRG